MAILCTIKPGIAHTPKMNNQKQQALDLMMKFTTILTFILFLNLTVDQLRPLFE